MCPTVSRFVGTPLDHWFALFSGFGLTSATVSIIVLFWEIEEFLVVFDIYHFIVISVRSLYVVLACHSSCLSSRDWDTFNTKVAATSPHSRKNLEDSNERVEALWVQQVRERRLGTSSCNSTERSGSR